MPIARGTAGDIEVWCGWGEMFWYKRGLYRGVSFWEVAWFLRTFTK